MSSFPPKSWSVRFLQDMEIIECGLVDGDNLTMEAMVVVRPASGQEGNFRFALAGPEMLKLSFPVSKVLAGSEFDSMVAEVEMKPGDQIKLAKNSISTDWWDFEDLVLSQDAVVTNGSGQDMGDEFLLALGHNKELVAQKPDRPGLCIRWLLGTRSGSRDVVLMAQVRLTRNKLYYFYT